jgi:site-specific DNA-methyltransferase (adenine-specific)/modification methylase
MRQEQIGNATLYCGDCLEILPTLGHVDAIVTDPPYGIGCDRENLSQSCGMRKDGTKRKYNTWSNPRPKGYKTFNWDSSPPKQEIFNLILKKSDKQIIFGGNYFSLPLTGGWLVWDKETVMPSALKCELAWTNFLGHTEIFHFLWSGYRKAEPISREHPTQKPIRVMQWCLSFLDESKSILDPFMGSGTTGIACVNFQKDFIGIETNEHYFDIACRRIEEAVKQKQFDFSEAVS